VSVITQHTRPLVLGTLIALATFVLFYLLTVFMLSWATTQLGYTRPEFLRVQLFTTIFFGATIPLSAVLADWLGRRSVLIATTIASALFGFLTAPMFGSGDIVLITAYLSLGLALMGMTYGPLGTLLSEMFPAEVRYTGASLTFNLAGIFGASLAPFIAVRLANDFGLTSVGYYLTAAAAITLVGLVLIRETRGSAE
jgi:MFS family permease